MTFDFSPRRIGRSDQTTKTGDVTELNVQARLEQLGFVVLKPHGNNRPYDLVFEDPDTSVFYRVQCKSAALIGNQIKFNVCSTSTKQTYAGRVEFLGLYCKVFDTVYMIPIEKISASVRTALLVKNAVEFQVWPPRTESSHADDRGVSSGDSGSEGEVGGCLDREPGTAS